MQVLGTLKEATVNRGSGERFYYGFFEATLRSKKFRRPQGGSLLLL